MRIGIIGGTFDPIHYGHLVIAEAARWEFALSQVVFVPAGRPPHKRDQVITPAEHRLAMVRLAVASNPYFSVSAVEVERPGPSYTVDTLKIFCGKGEVYFITGADSVAEIGRWHRVEEILQRCWIVAATRPGYSNKKSAEQLAMIDEKLRARILPLSAPGVAVSATEIRGLVREGKPIRYLLPEEVEKYIRKYALYG